MLPNLENYGYYKELVQTGYQTIYTRDLTNDNIDKHFKNIINILSDGIEQREVQLFKIHVVFPDDELDLFIIQYMYNLMFWTLIVCAGYNIESIHLFFEKVITKGTIKNYVDKFFLRKNIKSMELIDLNQNIDRCIGKFRDLINFQMFLCNTLDFKDTVDFMREFPEFNEAVHLNIDGIPMEDIKEYGMKATSTMIDYITRIDRDHNSKYSFIAKEGTNVKQFKEVMTNIGTKPNGQGGVFAHPILTSFVNGGLQTVEDVIIDSSIGRIAQILQKQNVGQSGAFARRLGLNNQDSKLHIDPEYSCNTRNFQQVYIKDKNILEIFDMRWYRFKENGMDYLLDATKDTHLIGQTLLFRSPMTCNSAVNGDGICYKCYGNLAYANRNINIGQIASELLSSIYTQRLLSAKHLLESAIIKMEWVNEFYQLFNVEFDQIMLKDELEYKKMKLIISSDDILEDENDDDEMELDNVEEGVYVYSFTIRMSDGKEVIIRTTESDPIYLTGDLQTIMNAEGTNDEDNYEIDMSKLKEKCLFTIDIQNDELSKVMKQVKNLIDNKSSIKSHDRNSILEAFIDANLSGGIRLNSVHFEVLLMNQMRAYDDILSLPDWSRPNEKYQIVTLENALTDNLSITVRLQSPKLKRSLIHPSNRRLTKASNMDLFYMEHPQDFMSGNYPESQNEYERKRKVIKPVIFEEDEHSLDNKK